MNGPGGNRYDGSEKCKKIAPSIKILDDKILISFSKWHILIDVESDRLYLNGDRLKTTATEFPYLTCYATSNHETREYARIKTLKTDYYSLVVSRGRDGRIFFNCYDKHTLKTWRGQKHWTASYWHDRKAKEIRFYENDLSRPKKVWSYVQKKPGDKKWVTNSIPQSA